MSENLLDFIGYHEKWHGDTAPKRLKYKFNQNDHLIQEIFKRLGIENGTFLEFGAIDGIKGSNTRLLYKSGWSKGILIECNQDDYELLEQNYKNEKEIYTFCVMVDDSKNKLDDIIEKTGIDRINFCSIDIDGLDLKVFNAVEKYLPDVVCIEGGQCLDPFDDEIPEDLSKNNLQQSLKRYCEVFKSKGYVLIASYQDNIFVKKEYSDLFKVDKKDILDFYIEGILAYPRIPWLVQQCVINNVQNRFLNFLISDMKLENVLDVAQSDTKTKASWINKNYKTISEKCKIILKNKEHIL